MNKDFYLLSFTSPTSERPEIIFSPVEKIFYIFVFPERRILAVADEGLDAIEKPVDRKCVHRIRDSVVQRADPTRHFPQRRHLGDRPSSSVGDYQVTSEPWLENAITMITYDDILI